MAKQNIKQSPKGNLDNKHVAKKLETATKNVLSKGMYFSVKTKSGEFDIVNATSRTAVCRGVYLPETARTIVTTLNSTARKKITPTLVIINTAIKKYQDDVTKHYNDLIFYKHTMRTTTDDEKFFVIESRADMSIQRLRSSKDNLHSHIRTSY
jgi:hypothetical protein|tara:strand:- start:429 stop:887 length:459 start_codon:yes stop_codon:yes gene_type:complete